MSRYDHATVRAGVDAAGPRFCDTFIEFSDPWAGTYCKLPNGHDGPHSAHDRPSTYRERLGYDDSRPATGAPTNPERARPRVRLS